MYLLSRPTCLSELNNPHRSVEQNDEQTRVLYAVVYTCVLMQLQNV